MSALLLALLLPAAPAAAAGAGTTAAEFLRFGAGPEVALAEAGGAAASGASAAAWNPAGLAALEAAELYGAHRALPEGISHQFLAGAVPVPAAGGVAGYSLAALQSGSIPELDNAGNETGSFTVADMAHALLFARAWGGTRAGLAAGFVSQSIAGRSGAAFAGSAGVQRALGPWTLGLSVLHLGSALKLASESNPLPATVRAGGAWTGLEGRLRVALDVTSSEGRGTRAHLGVEGRLWSQGDGSGVSLRAGYASGGRDADGPSGLAAGLGLRALGSLRADLAYLPFGKLGSAVQVGFGWSFR